MSEADADRSTRATEAVDDLVLPSQLLAARLRECIDTVRKPTGKPFTDQEIAEGIRQRTRSPGKPQGIGTRSYIWELKNGKSRTPGKGPPRPSPEVLHALADFFHKPPGYFLASSRDHAEAVAAQVDVFEALQRLGPMQLGARSFTLDGWARDPTTPVTDAAPPPADAATLRKFAATLHRAADALQADAPETENAAATDPPWTQPPFTGH